MKRFSEGKEHDIAGEKGYKREVDAEQTESSLAMVYLATGNPSSHNNGSSSSIGGGGNGTTSASERSSHDDRDLEDSSDGEREGTIRVGKDYQASIPPYIEENREYHAHNSLF